VVVEALIICLVTKPSKVARAAILWMEKTTLIHAWEVVDETIP